MRCANVRQKLDLYVTKELTHTVRERVEAQMRSCEPCREALARLRRLEYLVAASPAPPVPEGLAARIVARAGERQAVAVSRPPSPRRRPRLAWARIRWSAGIAAALAAGLVLGALMGHTTWRTGGEQLTPAATQPDGLLAASRFEHLVEPGGDSLAQAYVRLTTAPDH